MIIGHISKTMEKKEKEGYLSYSKVPFTLALSKRKYDEEQRKKYNIPKNKKADLL